MFDFSLGHKYLWVNIYLQVMEQRNFPLCRLNIQREYFTMLDASNDSIETQGNERWRVKAPIKVEQEYSEKNFTNRSLRNCYRFYYTIELLWKNDSCDKILFINSKISN